MTPTEEGKLSKDEVDALLQATEQEEITEEEPAPQRRIQSYNFQQPSRFNRSQLEKLKALNEALAQSATSHASRLLRSNVTTQLVSMDQMAWRSLVEEAGEAVAGFAFVLDPLGYRGVLCLDSQFAVATLERMMGGEAEAAKAGALDFSPLDVRVLARFLEGFLQPLPELWSRIGEFVVERGDFIEDLQAVDIFQADADFVQICFLMQTAVGSGQISLCVPFEAVRSLPPDSELESRSMDGQDAEVAADLRKHLNRTEVELKVLLGSTDIRVGRLLKAEPGDVLVLDTRIGESVDVKVNDRVRFRGLPGARRGKAAVKLIIEET